jgi:polyhydroxyalkanoate synthesis regulator phasin
MQKARGRVQDRLARVRETLDVPSREDIATLQQRLDRLSERLEALLQQRQGQD